MNSHTIAVVAVFVSAILGSATAGIAKKGLEEIPPYAYTFLRFFVASLVVLPFFLYIKGHKVSKMKELIPTSLLATANVVFFIVGVNLTTANVGVVIYAGVPILVAVILYVLFKKRLSKGKEVGILFGFIGVLLITFLPLLEKGNPFAGTLFGNFLLIIAIILWAFYTVFSKQLQEKYSPFLITCNFIFISTVATVPLLLWDVYTKFGWWEHVGFWGVFSIFYVAVIITIINYMLIQYSIKHGGAIIASTMFYLSPIFGFGINFLLLGELLTPWFIFGSFLALVGTYLVVRK